MSFGAGFKEYLVRRTVFAAATFLLVLILNFAIPRLMPGNPITQLIITPQMTPERQAAMIKMFGLDQPVHLQFIKYVMNSFRGNFGISYHFYPTPVISVISHALPWTVVLLLVSTSLSTLIGIYMGIISGWRRGTNVDMLVSNASLFFRSMPVFWLGMIFLLVFSYQFRFFPLGGAITPGAIYNNYLDFVRDYLRHAVLPIVCLTLYNLATYTLIMRNTMINVLGEDYITTAHAKGLSNQKVMLSHAARNALLPTITVVGMNFGFVVGGAVLTETVFSYPGMGRLIYTAVLNNDYALIQGAFFIIAIMVILANYITDILYSILDPRISFGGVKG